jgi:hypothetical protein
MGTITQNWQQPISYGAMDYQCTLSGIGSSVRRLGKTMWLGCRSEVGWVDAEKGVGAIMKGER